jgi:hypothetical protein
MFQAETWVRIVVSESEPAMFKDDTLKDGTSLHLFLFYL